MPVKLVNPILGKILGDMKFSHDNMKRRFQIVLYVVIMSQGKSTTRYNDLKCDDFMCQNLKCLFRNSECMFFKRFGS